MSRPGRQQRGLGHAALLLALVVLAVVVGGGFYAYTSNKQQTAQRQAEQAAETERQQAEQAKQEDAKLNIARTDKEQILVALNTYCKNQYKEFWEGTYSRSFDTNVITSGYDDSVKDPFVIEGDYALVRAAKCDTPQLTELQKFAPFMLYFNRKDDVWKARERYQTTPPCKDFANETWPRSVLPECAEEKIPANAGTEQESSPEQQSSSGAGVEVSR